MAKQLGQITSNHNFSSMLNSLSQRLFMLCFRKCGQRAEFQQTGRRASSYPCIKAKGRRPTVAVIAQSHSSRCLARYLRTFFSADYSRFLSVKDVDISLGSFQVGPLPMQYLHYDCWHKYIMSLTNHFTQHSLI